MDYQGKSIRSRVHRGMPSLSLEKKYGHQEDTAQGQELVQSTTDERNKLFFLFAFCGD